MSLAKVIQILKHSVRVRRNLLCGGVAACPSTACVLCAVQSTAHPENRVMDQRNKPFYLAQKVKICTPNYKYI